MKELALRPTQPSRLRATVTSSSGDWRLFCRNRQWSGLFLLLWLSAWTVGCVMLAVQVLVHRQWGMILLAIPFWASWIFVFCIVLKSFLQTEALLIDGSGFQYEQRVIIGTKRWRIPVDEVRTVICYSTVTDSESGRTQEGLEIQGAGKSRRCLQGLAAQELRWIAWQMNERISQLQGGAAGDALPAAAAEAAPEDHGAEETDEQADASLLILNAARVHPPSDSRWSCRDDNGRLAFVWRGRLRLANVAGALFVNLFWNGIVSVFVLGLMGVNPGGQGGEWWGLFFFLIPFEVIGLLMLVALLYEMGQPVHRRLWIFEPNSLTCRSTWLDLGPQRQWDVLRLARLDLRREDATKVRNKGFRWGTDDRATTYQIVFVTLDEKELCSINELTEGEAGWMSQAILRHCSRWFK